MNEDLEKLLAEVGKYIRPKKERTLFALGGRGHYENPVSDLLAFFMDPEAEHGLGTFFIGAFLECLQDQAASHPEMVPSQLPLKRVWISREEGTENRKRIDLVLRGTGWMMLIENKIYHTQINPVLEYKDHFTKLNGGVAPWMVVLSPDGKTDWADWLGVSYRDYCHKLKGQLGRVLVENTYSKWVVFARELILHLENELYTATMENNTIEFVEGHFEKLTQAKKLMEDYRIYLHQALKRLLEDTLGDPGSWTKEDNWAIRCYGSRWGQANIAWWYDSSQSGNPVRFTVYVPNPSPIQLEKGKVEFEVMNMEPSWESAGRWIGWHGRQGFGSSKEAMNEFVRLAKVVEEMFKTTETPPVESNAERFVVGVAGAED